MPTTLSLPHARPRRVTRSAGALCLALAFLAGSCSSTPDAGEDPGSKDAPSAKGSAQWDPWEDLRAGHPEAGGDRTPRPEPAPQPRHVAAPAPPAPERPAPAPSPQPELRPEPSTPPRPEPAATAPRQATVKPRPGQPGAVPTSRPERPAEAAGGGETAWRVEDYIDRLCADEETAADTYRELWDVPRRFIPGLILRTRDARRSPLKELPVLILDTERFVRINESDGSLVYTIPGMGRFEYDDIAAGKVRSGRSVKAILRSRKGFPVGVVIRAALINRFRSRNYPGVSDKTNCVAWWQRFYERVKSKL